MFAVICKKRKMCFYVLAKSKISAGVIFIYCFFCFVSFLLRLASCVLADFILMIRNLIELLINLCKSTPKQVIDPVNSIFLVCVFLQ